MPRRREVPKRKIIPDPKYKDKLVAKFTNSLMQSGKKATAEAVEAAPEPIHRRRDYANRPRRARATTGHALP